jgi:hypothetical protein
LFSLVRIVILGLSLGKLFVAGLPGSPSGISSMAMQQEPIHWRYRFHVYKAYFLGLNFREDHHNSYGQKYGTVVPYLHVLDPGIPIDPSKNYSTIPLYMDISSVGI